MVLGGVAQPHGDVGWTRFRLPGEVPLRLSTLVRLATAVGLAAVVSLTAPTVAGAMPHQKSTLRCSHGQIIVVAVSGTPATVTVGQNETITASALNCTRQTQTVSEVDETIKPTPCTDVTFAPSPDTFAPKQHVSNTFPIPTSNCPGTWGFKIDLYQGTILVATAQTSWTVTA